MKTRSQINSEWQQRQREAGRCTTCAAPAGGFTRCEKCRSRRNRYAKEYRELLIRHDVWK